MVQRKKNQQARRKRRKPTLRIAIIGLTSCDGCSVAAIDMGAEFIAAVDHFDLGDFFLIMDEKNNKPYDVTFIEGAPLTQENIKHLKAARKRTKVLVSYGACACQGVIPNIKNYIDKGKAVRIKTLREIKLYGSPFRCCAAYDGMINHENEKVQIL